MINSRIALSIASIGAASAIIIGGTFAFFSDSETSTGNTFQAGKLDLKVDSECHYFQNEIDVGCGEDGNWTETDLNQTHKFFNFNDIKPGDRGEDTVSLHVYNNDAWGRFVITDVLAQDDDLRQNLLFKVWLDEGALNGFQCSPNPGQPGSAKCQDDPTEGDNVQQETEPTLITEGTVDAQGESHNIYDGLAGAYLLNQCTGNGALADACPGLAPDGRMIGSITYFFGIGWTLPSQTGNNVQGDSLSATMQFQVVQARNNPDKLGF